MKPNRARIGLLCLAMLILPTGVVRAETTEWIEAWGDSSYGQGNVPSPNDDFIAVASGDLHSLGLKADSTIVAWGWNESGQCDVPEPNAAFVQVDAGYLHSLGLRSDGTIVAWGDNSVGQCNVPEPNVDFVDIATGGGHGLGLKADSTIVAWGYNDSGQCDVPAPNADFVAVGAGQFHSLGIKADGTIVAWGANAAGQCDVPEPNTNFVVADGSEIHSLGLKSDGSIVAWGSNDAHQCDVPEPNNNFVGLAAGHFHSLGVKADGTIVAWGANAAGQCDVPEPNADFVAVAAGYLHSLGLRNSEPFIHVLAPNGGEVWYVGRDHMVTWCASPSIESLRIELSRSGFEGPWDLLFSSTPNDGSELWSVTGPTATCCYVRISEDLGGGLTDVSDSAFEIRWPGLIAHWMFDEGSGTSVNDSSGYGNHGQLFLWDYQWVEGVSGTALRLWDDGVVMDIPASMDDPVTDHFTVAGWVKWEGPTEANSYILDARSTVLGFNFLIRTEDQKLALWVLQRDEQHVYAGGEESVPIGSWVHVAAVFDGPTDEIRLYLGGDPDTVIATDRPYFNTDASCAIGNNRWGGPNSALNGAVDDLRVYNTALSREEIQLLAWGSAPDVRAVTFVNPPDGGSVDQDDPFTPQASFENLGDLNLFHVPIRFRIAGPAPDTTVVYEDLTWVDVLHAGVGPQTVTFQRAGMAAAGEYTMHAGSEYAGDQDPTNDEIVGTFSVLPGEMLGSIVAWGWNEYGQCDVPAPNEDFVGGAGGAAHSLGLKSDGTILAWGDNDNGQCNLPSPNDDFIAVASGDLHSLGLKADSTIVAWGNNEEGQCNVPAPKTDFVAIAGGAYHSLGLKSDGTIVAWGWNEYGQCDVPAPNTDFVALAGGWKHSLGLKSDSSIVAWGGNEYGQCDVPAPNADFVAVAAGYAHNLGLKSDGTIVAWGGNEYGQCDVPTPNADFLAVEAGWVHSVGLKSDGTIVAWGNNDGGQCNVPVPNAGFVAVAGGGYHSLAIRGSTPTAVAEPVSSDMLGPLRLAILSLGPNPFNPSTAITFETPVSSSITLGIYDATGRRIRTEALGHFEPGLHRAVWDGRDASGAQVSPGVYFMRIHSPGEACRPAKVIVIR